ncbi:hypothetical protein DFJ67_3584 [Asanoa ferruginea]|uniref:Uncharacterized protein n=1 Tax=Asanoa ferruginea TaxID=53367 RepID=A0A3D9ZV84_9ACTN|nr:hypothetical protein [Asanoa ferruginea]REF97580.1 hypothetical protein DFJ67_3584 [Asanoa ferruginea]GIF48680.1 hypothetical protein Afe04nite_32190 [Asanoa ferruginea]
MSLLHALASRVETVRSDLPVAEVSVATGRLREATALLAATLESSAASSAAPLLASATSHLDAAAGALGRAGEELDRYLASVGVFASAASVVVSGSCPWADRVDVLTGQVGAARPAVEDLSVDLVLAASVRAALAGSAAGLRQVLVAAPPSVGWALGARAAGLLGVAEPALVRRGAADRLPALLPGLSASAGSALVSRALRLPAPSVSAHAADVAAVGVVLVSVVFGLTGRS